MIKNINKNSLPLYCIVFCFVLFLSITITPPAFVYHDEWISGNQLNQLANGHQITYSEGKYGTLADEEMYAFFTHRANVLAYGLFLPVLSLPAYYLFLILDSGFRFFVTIIWVLMPIIIALLTLQYYPNHSKIHGISWPFLLIFLTFILFLLNIVTFYPFTAAGIYDPVEAAALIFTGHILLAFMSVVFLFICRLLFNNQMFSTFGAVAMVCSSSYLFWTSSAKDHILTVTVFAVIFASTLYMIKKNEYKFGIIPFIACGLLAWVRPELALVTTILVLLLYAWHFIPEMLQNKPQNIKKIALLCIIPLFIIIGAAPFLVNNAVMSGNPLVPPYLFMEQQIALEESSNISATGDVINPLASSDSSKLTINNRILDYFIPQFETLPSDLYNIFFTSFDGKISILAICPLFLIGIILYFTNYVNKTLPGEQSFRKEIIICIAFIITVFLTYISQLHGQITSPGIWPDYRYLSPVYIPAGLFGLIALFNLFKSQRRITAFAKNTLLTMAAFTPVAFMTIFLFPPFGGGRIGYTSFEAIVTYILCAILGFVILYKPARKVPNLYSILTGVIISIPLIWNMFLVIMLSYTRLHGYGFWLPLVGWLYGNCVVIG